MEELGRGCKSSSSSAAAEQQHSPPAAEGGESAESVSQAVIFMAWGENSPVNLLLHALGFGPLNHLFV